MELLRNGFASVLGSSESSNGDPTSKAAETIERLVERLRCANLLEDRRDTCRALKAMSRKYRTEVGVQALDDMVEILEKDRSDEEALGYALDTLANICSPEEFEEEIVVESQPTRTNRSPSTEKQYGCIGEQFTEIFLKHQNNVQLVLDSLEEYDFKVRRPAIKLLTNLLVSKPRLMQEIILKSQMGVSRLMDVLVDSREVLRNDALLLLIQLTKGHANLQKIVAFNNAFDTLSAIVEMEGYSDGIIVVEDCLKLMLNLLRNNASNQTFFREGSYIQRISLFFDLNLDEQELEVGWAAQKVSNMLYMLSVIRTLVSPSNPTQVANSCQSTISQCGLFQKFCHILMAVGIPADILTETIVALGECIRGHDKNQEIFSTVMAPSEPPRPALILLLMSMVNDKQPFELRCAILYCLQCYLYKNPKRQEEVMSTLLPNHEAKDENDITAGQLLCGGLFASDCLSNWLSAVALTHGMIDQEGLKTELLKVQVASIQQAGAGPSSLLDQCLSILQQSNNVQTRIGLLMLISNWTCNCLPAVIHVLQSIGIITFLSGQIGSNEHDDMERLSQGLCAYLLGLLIIGNDNSVSNYTQEELMQLIEKRIGIEIFLDKLSEVSKHEAYNRALKHPQIKCAKPGDLVFDHSFCQLFKHQEHLVIHYLNKSRSDDVSADPDPGVLMQYKELIRAQDQRISQISQGNLYLQQELTNAKAQIEELNTTIQTLQDQNSLIKAQKTCNGPTSEVVVPNNAKHFEMKIDNLEKELKIRDDIIHELEVRWTLNHDESSDIEIKNLQKQLEALQNVLAKRENEIEEWKQQCHQSSSVAVNGVNITENGNNVIENDLKSAYETLQGEQEDLLLMLSDQDTKLNEYKKKLKSLGFVLDEDEDEEDCEGVVEELSD